MKAPFLNGSSLDPFPYHPSGVKIIFPGTKSGLASLCLNRSKIASLACPLDSLLNLSTTMQNLFISVPVLIVMLAKHWRCLNYFRYLKIRLTYDQPFGSRSSWNCSAEVVVMSMSLFLKSCHVRGANNDSGLLCFTFLAWNVTLLQWQYPTTFTQLCYKPS